MPARKKIGELLVEAGVVAESDVRTALGQQKAMGGRARLGEMLIANRGVSRTAVARALATQFELPFVQLPEIPHAVAVLIPVTFQEEHRLVPFKHEVEGKSEKLHLAVADPGNLDVLDDLRFNLRKTLRVYVAAADDIDNALAVLKGEKVEELQPITMEEDHTELQLTHKTTDQIVGGWFDSTGQQKPPAEDFEVNLENTPIKPLVVAPPAPPPEPLTPSVPPPLPPEAKATEVPAPPPAPSGPTMELEAEPLTPIAFPLAPVPPAHSEPATFAAPVPSAAVRHAAADLLDDLLGGMEGRQGTPEPKTPAIPNTPSSPPVPDAPKIAVHQFSAKAGDPKQQRFEFSEADLHVLDNLERLATGDEAVLEGDKVRPARMVASLIRLLIKKGLIHELEFLEELARK